MTTKSILLITFLMILFACNNKSVRNRQTSLTDTNLNESQISKHSLQNPNYSKCTIDTSEILKNENLDSLINKLENTELTTYKTVKKIPVFLMDFLKCTTGGKFQIANPDEKWQVTDNHSGELPPRKLVFFELDSDIALLAYYTGGIGKSEHILIFKFENEVVFDFWCGNILNLFSNKTTIIRYLKDNKIRKMGLNSNFIYL
jgi:hypothetical protein